MKKTLIGLSMVLLGLFCIGFQGLNLYRIVVTPFTGSTATAVITGFKISHYSARKVLNPISSGSSLKGRSPWFDFKTADNQTISTYSNALQLFYVFGYDMNEKVTVAYHKDAPEQAVIVNWREFPGLIFMMLFGLLCVVVSKEFLFKSS
jgi:hypothetical protein